VAVDRMVLAFAGIFILGSLLLSQIHHPYWLFFTAFVGANLFAIGLYRILSLSDFFESSGSKTGPGFLG
jgi:hypothetical protein